MSDFILERTQMVPVSINEAFAFFADPHNLEAITPPQLGFCILSCPDRLSEGARIGYRIRIHGVPVGWQTVIEDWEPGVRFVDSQARGPYAFWRHEHTFFTVPGGTQIRDHVEYTLPFGVLGRLTHALLVQHDLREIFDYRRARILDLVRPA